jgi:AraC family transcriptional regulator
MPVGQERVFRHREACSCTFVVPRCARVQRGSELRPHAVLAAAVLARVIEYLETHLADDVSVAELAKVAGLSTGHFSGLFRNATGEPPHRYHTRLRVQRARRLIERGASASAAALQVGFFDQSHLTRHMRRLLATSPGKLRKRR